jgi:mannose-1-phosphate guanylyltransferase
MEEAIPSFPKDGFLREPSARDTGPVLGLVLARLLQEGVGEEDRLALLPSDHVIAPAEQFHATLHRVLDLASGDGRLWTLGIRPREPATGFGYIRMGEALPKGGHRVLSFIEKPSLEKAKTLLKGGCHLWNSGILVGTLGAFLKAFEERNPIFLQGIQNLAKTLNEAKKPAIDQAFFALEKTSIDYILLEGNKNLGVLDAEFSWKDLGSFDTLGEDLEKDEQGNALLSLGSAKTLLMEANHNLCINEGEGTLTLLGVRDLIVVRNGNRVLILPRGRSQDIKGIVQELERRGWEDQL